MTLSRHPLFFYYPLFPLLNFSPALGSNDAKPYASIFFLLLPLFHCFPGLRRIVRCSFSRLTFFPSTLPASRQDVPGGFFVLFSSSYGSFSVPSAFLKKDELSMTEETCLSFSFPWSFYARQACAILEIGEVCSPLSSLPSCL